MIQNYSKYGTTFVLLSSGGLWDRCEIALCTYWLIKIPFHVWAVLVYISCDAVTPIKPGEWFVGWRVIWDRHQIDLIDLTFLAVAFPLIVETLHIQVSASWKSFDADVLTPESS